MAIRSLAGLVLTACVTPMAVAAQADIGFGVGAEYSDNITLAPEGFEESGWVAVVGTRLRVVEHSAEDDFRVLGTLEYRDYQDVDFDDEFVLSMDATGYWTLIPGKLTWHVEDYFDQATVDILSAPTPGNRQDTNVLSTGPEARWRLSPSQTVIAGARYGNFYFEESEADSHRFSGYGRWQYAISPRRDVSANLEMTQAEFVEDSFGDYRRADVFARLTNRLGRSTLTLDAGTTAIDRERHDDINGFLGRIGWNIRTNSYSGIDAHVSYQYTDTGHNILETASRDGAIGTLNEQVSGDLFYSRQSELAYYSTDNRTYWRIAGAVRDEDYEVFASDRRHEEGNFHFGYELTETLRSAVTLTYRHSEYYDLDQVDTDRNAGVHLSYQANSRLAAALEFSRSDRDSNISSAAFTENRVRLTLNFDRGPAIEPVDAEE